MSYLVRISEVISGTETKNDIDFFMTLEKSLNLSMLTVLDVEPIISTFR